jgi:heat-inducible transcriptional repressor
MDLSQRARQILYACITEFVATGEPVGSRTLSRKSGIDLSPASIRNVLADLEEAGYLMQPHTSAGRIPTDKAFRLFVDAMMEVRELSRVEHERIRTRFEELGSGQNLMRETGRLLSDLTGAAAVVVTPRAESLTLKQIRFVRTQPGEVLAVLIMSSGAVQNRFVKVSLSDEQLVQIHNLLDDVIEGRSLGELRDLFARRLATERVQHDALKRTAFELGGAAIAGAVDAGVDVVIEGRSRLLDAPDFSGAEGLKQVVSALDDHEHIVALLDATLAARETSVLLGREAGDLGGGQLAIVGAKVTDHGRAAGSVGVIGPTRMDYPKVVPLVSATASAMSAFMDRTRAPDDDDDE